MRAAAFVAHPSTLKYRLGEREHVLQSLGKDHNLIGPVAGIAERANA